VTAPWRACTGVVEHERRRIAVEIGVRQETRGEQRPIALALMARLVGREDRDGREARHDRHARHERAVRVDIDHRAIDRDGLQAFGRGRDAGDGPARRVRRLDEPVEPRHVDGDRPAFRVGLGLRILIAGRLGTTDRRNQCGSEHETHIFPLAKNVD
jgi:hypothetical protein